jgi:hypothetical protein
LYEWRKFLLRICVLRITLYYPYISQKFSCITISLAELFNGGSAQRMAIVHMR